VIKPATARQLPSDEGATGEFRVPTTSVDTLSDGRTGLRLHLRTAFTPVTKSSGVTDSRIRLASSSMSPTPKFSAVVRTRSSHERRASSWYGSSVPRSDWFHPGFQSTRPPHHVRALILISSSLITGPWWPTTLVEKDWEAFLTMSTSVSGNMEQTEIETRRLSQMLTQHDAVLMFRAAQAFAAQPC
jgi:hypothetical protein